MTNQDAPQIKDHPLNKAAVALLKRFKMVPEVAMTMPVTELAWRVLTTKGQAEEQTGLNLAAAETRGPAAVLEVLENAVDAEELEAAASLEDAGEMILEVLTESPVNLDSDLARLDYQEAARLRQQESG